MRTRGSMRTPGSCWRSGAGHPGTDSRTTCCRPRSPAGRGPAGPGRLEASAAAGVPGHVGEARVVALEGHHDVLRGTVTVLGDEDVGLAGARGLLVVHVLAVQQDDHVRVLLDGTGLTQV